MTTWTVRSSSGQEVYSGRSEAKARRILDARKYLERVMLYRDGVLWVVAQEPPMVKTPESRRG